MKDVRPEFTPDEYERLKQDADRLNVSMKQLVHDRAVGIETETSPLNAAQLLAEEISKYRADLNEIVKRETFADVRLYEDDIIRIEASMNALEGVVSAFISEVLRKAKKYGNLEI